MNVRIYLPLAPLVVLICQPLASVEQSPQAQSVILPTAYTATFPRLLETLVDNGCIILAADQQLGFISFRSQSEDNTSAAWKRVNVLEGTILLRSETPNSTHIRTKLTLSHQDNYAIHGAYRTGVQRDADDRWYKGTLEMIAKVVPPSSK